VQRGVGGAAAVVGVPCQHSLPDYHLVWQRMLQCVLQCSQGVLQCSVFYVIVCVAVCVVVLFFVRVEVCVAVCNAVYPLHCVLQPSKCCEGPYSLPYFQLVLQRTLKCNLQCALLLLAIAFIQ